MLYTLLMYYLTLPHIEARCSVDLTDPLQVENPEVWKCLADEELARFTNDFPFNTIYQHTERPKNVILFVGDGMGMSTVTGARYLKANNEGKSAGDELLSWEKWPSLSLLRTMNANRMTTDSASATVALFNGAKAETFILGLTQGASCCRCDAIHPWQYTKSVFLQAQEAGLATGLVTTTRVTHATPAGAYANSLNRFWEAFVNTTATGPLTNSTACQDIAQQLLTKGIDFNVVFGGGAGVFYQHATENTPSQPGKRIDGQNLISKWAEIQAKKQRKHEILLNKTQFDQLDPKAVDYVLGLFASSDMDYDIERSNEQPSLAEMTEKAIGILERNPNGFLLLVEGGRIDHGHHVNRAKIALTETLAFEKAVNVAMNLTDPKQTLMVVTADHSHGYHVIGYASRNRSVLDTDDYQLAEDGMPYVISAYVTGPSAIRYKTRQNPLDIGNPLDNDYSQQALVPLRYASHAAEDVPLYATGPYSQMFQRTTDNTYVAYATMFALCLGPYQDAAHCIPTGDASVVWRNQYLLLTLTISLSYGFTNW